MPKKMTEEEENELYSELGRLDDKVKGLSVEALNISKDLAYVYKRRQQIYRLFGW